MAKVHFPRISGNQYVDHFYHFDQGIRATTGDVFFVSSVTGTNSTGYGRSPESPFASVDYCMGQITSANADRVYAMPGHTETLTAAGSSLGNGGVFIGSVLSNGVSIIGIGEGRDRPTFNYTTASAASMNIAAANVTLENLVFTPNGFSAITAAINLTGADFTMRNCEMQISTGTNACVLGILTAATAARMKILNCNFVGPATSTQTCTAAIKHEVGIDYLIRGCTIKGKLTSAILNATAVLGGNIDQNIMVVTTNDAIIMHASSTPFITNNRMNVSGGTAPITAAAGFVAGNVYSAAAGVTAGTAVTI